MQANPEKERFRLVREIFKALYKNKVLDELILVGSWCQFVYEKSFKNPKFNPGIKTLDIDFLVPNPRKISKEINIPEILKSMDFEEYFDRLSGLVKYVNPNLELEFLVSKLGRGFDKPVEIKKLHINATAMRYLNFLENFTIKCKFDNMVVTVPEPSAFVLHKFIVGYRRAKPEKRTKDLETAKDLGKFLVSDKIQRKRLIEICGNIPKKWQKTILENTKDYSEEVYVFLKEIKS